MTSLDLRVRTESSEECSYQSLDFTHFDQSFQSISLADSSLDRFIRTLKKTEDQQVRDHHIVSSRSQSYILISESQGIDKPKCTSMKKGRPLSLQLIDPIVMSKILGYTRCLNLARTDILNRAYGAMFGFVIGDAMGAYLINKPFNQHGINQALLMPGGGVLNLQSGEGTDEWQICLSLSQALIQGKGRYDPNLIAEKYLEWMDSDPFDLPVLMGISFGEIRKRRRTEGVLNFSTLGDQLINSSLRNIKQQSYLGLIRLIPLVLWSLELEDYQFNKLVSEEMRMIAPNALVRESAHVYANILRCIIKTGDHMLAYHQAAQYVCNFGSEQMLELWKCIEDNEQPIMTTTLSKNLKLPFIYSVNQVLEIDTKTIDPKKQFINSAAKILSKGFNTDTNCSIVLGMVGAVVGFNNIPPFYRNKIINSNPTPTKARSRDYHSKRVIEIVDRLVNEGARQSMHGEFF